MKNRFKHLLLTYFILIILGMQTGVHFFHDHTHLAVGKSKSKIVFAEKLPDCSICDLHISSALFFNTPEQFIYSILSLNCFLQSFINSDYIDHFYTGIQGRAPPLFFL
ncbi:MAG TPA: hypothetical protein VK766_02635 [Cytophagaceae bacterium]|nr:hypothetical protein [Cytophagaceae bacterium]